MQQLEINPKFQQYWPALDKAARKRLEESMLADLTTEPIFWWHNPVTDQDELLEGHHRYRIAQQHGLELQTHEKFFDTVDDAEEFVITWQIGRRNLPEHVMKPKYQRLLDIFVARGQSKKEAIDSVSKVTDVSTRTVYRGLEDEQEPTTIQAFYADKKEYDRDLERTRNKAVEKLKQKALKEGFGDDEDRMADEWQSVEQEIQVEFESRTVALESVAEAIAVEAEATGKAPVKGGPRKSKKSGQAKSALRSIKSYLEKIQSLSFHFPGGFIAIDWKNCDEWIKAQEVALGMDKKKFGRK